MNKYQASIGKDSAVIFRIFKMLLYSIGFGIGLTCVYAALQYFHVINWSYWRVVALLWTPFVFNALVLLGMLVLWLVRSFVKWLRAFYKR